MCIVIGQFKECVRLISNLGLVKKSFNRGCLLISSEVVGMAIHSKEPQIGVKSNFP